MAKVIRTAAGAKKYGKPIGSTIGAGGHTGNVFEALAATAKRAGHGRGGKKGVGGIGKLIPEHPAGVSRGHMVTPSPFGGGSNRTSLPHPTSVWGGMSPEQAKAAFPSKRRVPRPPRTK